MSIIICWTYGENILSCFFKTYIWRPRIFIMKYELSSFEYHQMIIGKTHGKLHKLECLYFKLKTMSFQSCCVEFGLPNYS
jgi:hypothetical protein